MVSAWRFRCVIHSTVFRAASTAHPVDEDAQANGFVASLKDNAETKMGLLHAAYGMSVFVRFGNQYETLSKWVLAGAGALCSPLVATQFAQAPRWSFHYLVSLAIAISNTIFLIAVFQFKTQDGIRHFTPIWYSGSHLFIYLECLVAIGEAPSEQRTSDGSTFRQILGHKTVHLLAFFILVYVGVEVTVGGS